MVNPKRNLIFISYSHQDQKWLELLKIHLKPLFRESEIFFWDDTQIKPGDKWRDGIENAIESAKIAILIVTPNFIASDFIVKDELPPLLEASEKEGLIIFWIAFSASSYKETQIANYQAAHDPTQPLDKMNEAGQNEALVEICKKLKMRCNETVQTTPVKSSQAGESEIENKIELEPNNIHKLVEELPAAIYQADKDGRFTYCNKWAAKILGYTSPKEMIGIEIKKHYADPADRDKLLNTIEQNGYSDNYRIELVREDKEDIVINANSRFISANDRESGIEGIFTDITELDRFKSLFDELPSGIYQLDEKFNITKCNRGFEKIFGYDEGELIGKNAKILYEDSRDMEKLGNELKSIFKSGKEPEIINRFLKMRTKDSKQVLISLNTHLRLNKKRRVIGREGAVTKITLEQAVENKLIRGYCFVSLPFSDDFLDIYKTIIKPVVESFEIQCFTAKDIFDGKKLIPDKTLEMIGKSNIFIADITGPNPNVIFEIGIAHAKSKDIVLLTQETQEERCIVNLRGREMIRYKNAIGVKNEESLELKLRKAITDIIKIQSKESEGM